MKKHTGLLGFVIIPNQETINNLRSLTDKFKKNSDKLPNPYHLSLYHGNLKNYPEESAKKMLENLKFLLGTTHLLQNIEPYGEKFLFWNVAKPFPNLQKAHNLILKDIRNYVDKEKIGTAIKEGLKMSKKELTNIKNYLHPLVDDLFLPHYSLLYRQGGIEEKSNLDYKEKVEKIQFVEIGSYSKINKVILSS